MTEELEEIFSEEVQRVANSKIEVERQQRDLMDYPCWIVHEKKEASKLLRLLDIYRCEHTDSVKNKELLGYIDYQLQTDDMRFVGIDISFHTFRSYVHFYKNFMKVIDNTYAIDTGNRFIINDDGMIVRCGSLMSDFLRLIMNKKLYEVDELLDEMNENVCDSLSNKLFKEILDIEYVDYFDVSPVLQDMYIFLKDDYVTKFNVYCDTLDTIMQRGTEPVTMRRKIHRCACYRLPDGTFDLAMILKDVLDSSSRDVFFRHFNNINEFLEMTVFDHIVVDTLNEHEIDIAAYYDMCFQKQIE